MCRGSNTSQTNNHKVVIMFNYLLFVPFDFDNDWLSYSARTFPITPIEDFDTKNEKSIIYTPQY